MSIIKPLQRILAFALLTLSLLFPALPTLAEEAIAPDTVNVIVDGKPLTIPASFKKTLEDLGIVSLTLTDGTGQIRVLDTSGNPLNICGPGLENTPAAGQTCKVSASINTIQSLAAAAGNCGSCQNANGALVSCLKSTQKYSCASPIYPCRSACQ